jgi:predicted 3-demethylubiquinone-9 3-methyltransferase (glyoxalase superfamily)
MEASMHISQRIAPFLWFDSQAEEAAACYVSIFKNSRIIATTRYSRAGVEIHHRRAGSVMTVAFELDGMQFTALNGGPEFRFNEAISLQVNCGDQEEIDYYWDRLSKGGDPKAQQCGWLKDKYGLSWQVAPTILPELLKDPESPNAERVMEALMKMKKLDIRELERAADAARVTA